MLKIKQASGPGQTQDVSPDLLRELLQKVDVSLWLDVDSPTSEEQNLLETQLKIHHLTMEDIVKQNQRPKIESFETYVYLTMHPLARKENGEIVADEVDLLLGRNWLVTVHYGTVSCLVESSNARERLEYALARGADFLLYTVSDRIVDGCFPILDEIDEEINALEERLLRQPDWADMNRLLKLKRSLVHIRRAIVPQREIFSQIARREFPFVRPDQLPYFQDVYDHLIRLTEELDSLREILSATLEVHLASVSNQLNVTMKRLSAWGTIFVVITAIAGIYGMNFEHMPELRWRYGYVAALALMAVISVGLYFSFKKRDFL